jgi:hypothetical protein
MILARFAGDQMGRFVEGTDRGQTTLFPECLEDWICEDNPVRVIEAFVEELDLADLRFSSVDPEATVATFQLIFYTIADRSAVPASHAQMRAVSATGEDR